MCGICGYINLDGAPVDRALLERMSSAIVHRGPDGSGIHIDGHVGLAHRRLAIIAVATGAQPMGNEDGSVTVTYNGEIYNFPELREELLARGHVLRTRSDTEVLVHLWEECGPAMVERLRGMFAFAIWDSGKRELFLARDRLGIKPLYYAQYGRRFAFASELKAICQDPSFPRRPKPLSVGRYFCLGYVPAPDTIYEDACKLPPAHTMVVRGGQVETPRKYWQVVFGGGGGRRPGDAEEELQSLLTTAVDEHFLSDVPVGVLLSGGVDSSLVTALACRAGHRVQTFSIGFPEADFSEAAHAEAVARHLGTDHVARVVQPDAVELLPLLARQYDEPFADSSALPTYVVSKLAAEHVKVVLSGDGGDEVFGGYVRYMLALRKLLPGRGMRLLMPLYERWALLRRLYRGLRAHRVRHTDYICSRLTMAAPRPARRLLSPEIPMDPELLIPPDLYKPGDFSLAHMQQTDIALYLPDDILTKVDRASMFCSLEVRPPFLDHRVVELGARLAEEDLCTGEEAKVALKRLARKLVPPEVIDRPKRGFGLPLKDWFRGSLDGFVRDNLRGPGVVSRGFFDPPVLDRLIDGQDVEGLVRGRCLWAALIFEFWAREWLRA